MTEAVAFGCQCGAVRFTGPSDLGNGQIFHCRMCRKATGSAFDVHVAVPNDALRWTRGART